MKKSPPLIILLSISIPLISTLAGVTSSDFLVVKNCCTNQLSNNANKETEISPNVFEKQLGDFFKMNSFNSSITTISNEFSKTMNQNVTFKGTLTEDEIQNGLKINGVTNVLASSWFWDDWYQTSWIEKEKIKKGFIDRLSLTDVYSDANTTSPFIDGHSFLYNGGAEHITDPTNPIKIQVDRQNAFITEYNQNHNKNDNDISTRSQEFYDKRNLLNENKYLYLNLQFNSGKELSFKQYFQDDLWNKLQTHQTIIHGNGNSNKQYLIKYGFNRSRGLNLNDLEKYIEIQSNNNQNYSVIFLLDKMKQELDNWDHVTDKAKIFDNNGLHDLFDVTYDTFWNTVISLLNKHNYDTRSITTESFKNNNLFPDNWIVTGTHPTYNNGWLIDHTKNAINSLKFEVQNKVPVINNIYKPNNNQPFWLTKWFWILLLVILLILLFAIIVLIFTIRKNKNS